MGSPVTKQHREHPCLRLERVVLVPTPATHWVEQPAGVGGPNTEEGRTRGAIKPWAEDPTTLPAATKSESLKLGDQVLSQHEEKSAVSCLRTIYLACGFHVINSTAWLLLSYIPLFFSLLMSTHRDCRKGSKESRHFFFSLLLRTKLLDQKYDLPHLVFLTFHFLEMLFSSS